jgi:AcrR family transcriptional regulator
MKKSKMNNTQQGVREKILEKSIRLFLEKGFVGTSVKELTDAAGVAKGTLYWYFSSKDQVLESILDKFSREYLDVAIEKVNCCDGNFLTKFNVLYRYTTEFARDNRELLLVFNTLLGEIIGNRTEAERNIREIQNRFHLFVKTLLENGKKEGVVGKNVDIHIQAHIVIASFTGMLLQWYLHEDSINAIEYARSFREAILRGLGGDDIGPAADLVA